MSCGVGHRHGLDSMLLWLWRRPVAIAPIRPRAWEPPHAAGVAQEKAKRQKKEKKKSIVTVKEEVHYLFVNSMILNIKKS